MNFSLGRLVITCGVNDLIADNTAFARFVTASLQRCRRRDWGEMDASDKKQNDDAVAGEYNRIFASYTNVEHPDWRIWIITEADRSYTTILFPSEY